MKLSVPALLAGSGPRAKPISMASANRAVVTEEDVATSEWLLCAVCARLGTTPELARDARRRTPRERLARREWLAGLWASGWAYAHVARVTGFDHTTVMWAVRQELGDQRRRRG